MLMLIWNNISRRRAQSALTVAITLLTVMVFVMVLGVFQTVNQGLALSRERLGADAVLIPKYASADGGDLLFTAIPENIYMSADVLNEDEQGRIAPDDLIMGGNFDDDFVGFNYLVLGKKFFVTSQLQPTGTGMDSTIFMDINTVRDLCLESDTLAVDWHDKDPHDYISVIMIKLQDGVDPEEFARQVEASGIEARCIITGDTIASLQDQLDVVMGLMFALWLASLLIAALVTIAASVIEFLSGKEGQIPG